MQGKSIKYRSSTLFNFRTNKCSRAEGTGAQPPPTLTRKTRRKITIRLRVSEPYRKIRSLGVSDIHTRIFFLLRFPLFPLWIGREKKNEERYEGESSGLRLGARSGRNLSLARTISSLHGQSKCRHPCLSTYSIENCLHSNRLI